MIDFRFLPIAEREVRNEAERYWQILPALEKDFLDELDRTIADLQAYPRSTPAYRGPFRKKSLSRFPFHIVYTLEPDFILIIALAHYRRQPDYWTRRVR